MSPPSEPRGARRQNMKLSTERILTTHVGSLPRSSEVVELLYKKDSGEPYDRAAFDAAVAAGVADAVAKQVAAGVDIVSDGETSKVGYSTYIKDRLSGFAGHHSRPPHLDLAPYPRAARSARAHARASSRSSARAASDRSSSSIARRCRRTSRTCAPRSRRTRGADRSVHERGVAGCDLGVPIESLLREPRRLRRRDRGGDEARVRRDRRRRLHAAARLPRSRDGAAHGIPGAQRSRVSRARRVSGRSAEPCRARHTGRAHAHAHLLGQLRRAARPRHRAREDSRDRLEGEAGRHPVRGGEPAASARVGRVARRASCPTTKC